MQIGISQFVSESAVNHLRSTLVEYRTRRTNSTPNNSRVLYYAYAYSQLGILVAQNINSTFNLNVAPLAILVTNFSRISKFVFVLYVVDVFHY